MEVYRPAIASGVALCKLTFLDWQAVLSMFRIFFVSVGEIGYVSECLHMAETVPELSEEEIERMFPRALFGLEAMKERQRLRLEGSLNKWIHRKRKP